VKAVRVRQFGDPEVLRLEEVPDLVPALGQVLIRIHAVGVNPVETYIRSGRYTALPVLPYTPGTDAAGIVEAIGPDVTTVYPADRVYTAGSITGTYAEMCLCDLAQVHPLPDQVSFLQGAAINIPYATAYRALFHRAKAQSGETVLIHGASGGVGIAAIQWARTASLTIIATAGSEPGRQLLRDQGVHQVLDHPNPGHSQQILDLTGGQGVDLILEMFANVHLGHDLDMLARFGRVVVVGSRGPVEINPRATMARDAAILGMTLLNASPTELAEIHAAIAAGLANGSLNPIVGRQLSLADAPRSHHEIIESKAFGKIILIPN